MSARRQLKQYPAYRDSGVEWLGKIPAHWELKRLKRVFRVVNGSTPASREPTFWEGEIPWVTPEDLGELAGPAIVATSRNITAAGYRSCGTTIVPPGSLVLSTRAPIGHLAMAGMDLCTNQGCRSLVFRTSASRKFFFYELFAARPEFESLGQGSTFRELAKGKLEDFGLVRPPVPEQHAIAAFLDRETARIDALVAKKERLIELLQEKRTATINRAVTKGLDPTVPMKDSGVEWLGEIPSHWDMKRLRLTIAACQNGVWGDEPDGVRDIVCVRVADFDRVTFRVDITEPTLRSVERRVAENRGLQPGDLLLEKSGGGEQQPVGVVVMYDHDTAAVCSNFIARVQLAVGHDPRYFTYLHASLYAQRVNTRYIKQSTGIQNLDSSSYFGEVVGLPRLSEQRAIVDFLDQETANLDALIAKVRDAIDRLKELRTALISAAVTGKIDVREEAA